MYTDIHSHVIWGVDDGAKTEQETRRMLQAAAADQIDAIIATPHVIPGLHPFPETRFIEHLERAREIIREEKLTLTLYPGAEIYYTEHTVRMLREGKVSTLANTDCILVEFHPQETYQHILTALQNLSSAGYTPIIAHLERYLCIRSLKQVEEIKRGTHALVQINTHTLLKKAPMLRRRYLKMLFQEGRADFIATDVHAIPGRETCMTSAMHHLAERYGHDMAERIRHNAARLVFSEE